MTTETLYPYAAGDRTEHNKNGAGTTFNWECVDDNPHDSDTSYIYVPYTSHQDYDLYNIPSSAGSGTINSVTISFVAKLG